MDDEAAMRRALERSAAVLGTTSPNPPVGAVVLDARGELVSEGATQPPGGPHAELVALRMAGVRAVGGTVVSTLGPCAHTGRTGPCTSAIIQAGIERVVLGATDPTDLGGGGAQVLLAAGVQVTSGVLPDEVERSLTQRRGDLERSRCAFGALPARAARSASCCWARCAATRAARCPPGATSARYLTASTARRTSAGSFELASARAICSHALMASARAARALALVRWAGRCRVGAPRPAARSSHSLR